MSYLYNSKKKKNSVIKFYIEAVFLFPRAACTAWDIFQETSLPLPPSPHDRKILAGVVCFSIGARVGQEPVGKKAGVELGAKHKSSVGFWTSIWILVLPTYQLPRSIFEKSLQHLEGYKQMK